MQKVSRHKPGYLFLAQTGELAARAAKANEILLSCTLCPHRCRTNRAADEKTGICKTGKLAPVASFSPHFGEEESLVGQHGSGTVFFGSCNLLCTFCQNHEISHNGETGCQLVSNAELSTIFLNLQSQGCHNINLVTPTHCVPQIISATQEAVKQGLSIPLVYNSSGYETAETLALLDGIVDIYMPDFKFWNNKTAAQFTTARDYGDRAREAVKIMHSQVGDLQLNSDGLAVKGLLVRHLVMPGLTDETLEIIRFLSGEVSERCAVNLMDQYRPFNKVGPPIDAPLSAGEYQEILAAADKTDLYQLNADPMMRLLKKLRFL